MYGSGKLVYGSGSFSTAPGSFSTAPGAFLRLREAFLRLRELFYGSGKLFYGSGSFSTAPGAFLRLRELFYGSGSFSTAPGAFLRLRELFYGSGSFSTAPGAFLRLRELFYGSGKFFYGSGSFSRSELRRELFYGSGSFSTAPGSFSTAPGAFLRLRELFYGSGSFSTAPGAFLRLRELVYGSGQAARRACLLPRSSTNSSKNNLTVWAAVSGRRRGIYSLYRASTAHATRFGRIEVRCEPRGCPTVFSWRISPYATSTPTRFGPRTRGPQLGSALTFLHSKAPFHVRFQYSGKTRCVANHANVRWLKQCVFHHLPLLLRHGSDQNFHFSSTRAACQSAQRSPDLGLRG